MCRVGIIDIDLKQSPRTFSTRTSKPAEFVPYCLTLVSYTKCTCKTRMWLYETTQLSTSERQ